MSHHVFVTDQVSVTVEEFGCGAQVTFTAEDGATASLKLEFINNSIDGATMADTLMVALRDATRVDCRHLELAS